MGINLKNPVVAGASALTANLQSIKRIADSGAAAVVISSLFEEQIQLASYQLDEELQQHDEQFSEMTSMFPKLEHAGVEEHMMWVKRAKENLDIPVFASLNAVSRETWVEYASKLAETGVDGLELNFYSLPIEFGVTGSEVEQQLVDVLTEVKNSVQIPVAVKLSAFYTSPLNIIRKLDETGVDGFVLFNRLFHPKINVESESNDLSFNLSSPADHRLALRFAGILHGHLKGDICANTGIHTANEVIATLLAGANVVQVVSTLFRNKIEYLSVILEDLEEWMNAKGYDSPADFRGNLSKDNNTDPWTYTRAKYIKVLRQPGQYMVK